MVIRRSGDTIADELAEGILAERWAAGSRLPSERQLAEEFRASRPVIREALRSLLERGLIEVQAGRGTFVRAPDALARTESIDLQFRRNGVTARQLSEARLMLETEAAGLAAERASEMDLAELEAALDRLEHAASPVEQVRGDLAFHLILARAAHNPVIEMMFRSIAGLAVELMVRSAADPAVVGRSGPYHRAAFEAVAAHDAAAARAALRAHLRVASETYGDDYDRNLDTTAFRALRLLGQSGDLSHFIRSILPAGRLAGPATDETPPGHLPG